MAIAVEQNYSKDQILAMYLNSVYFGENAFGVEEAAKAYEAGAKRIAGEFARADTRKEVK